MTERIVIKDVEVSDEYCYDVMTTAVEGGFSSEWFSFDKVERNADLSITSMEVTDHYEETQPIKNFKVGAEEIKKAIKLVQSAKLADSFKQQIYSDDLDAIAADAVLQLAVFGEVIYG